MLQRNTTLSTGFEIYAEFVGGSNDTLAQEQNLTANPILQSVSFLTQDRLQVPCACDIPTLTMRNQSDFNEGWWEQTTSRVP